MKHITKLQIVYVAISILISASLAYSADVEVGPATF